MLEKLLLRKCWKIIRKTFSAAFFLRNLSCTIHPPVTTLKLILLQIFPLFIPRIF